MHDANENPDVQPAAEQMAKELVQLGWDEGKEYKIGLTIIITSDFDKLCKQGLRADDDPFNIENQESIFNISRDVKFAFKRKGAVVVDGVTGKLISAGFWLATHAEALQKSKDQGSYRRVMAASVTSSQEAYGECTIITASSAVTRANMGDLFVYKTGNLQPEKLVVFAKNKILDEDDSDAIARGMDEMHAEAEKARNDLENQLNFQNDFSQRVRSEENLPSHIKQNVVDFTMRHVRRWVLDGLTALSGDEAHGMTLIIGDADKLMKRDAEGFPEFGEPHQNNRFKNVNLTVFDPGIVDNTIVQSSLTYDCAVVVDGMTGKFCAMNYTVGDIRRGDTSGGSRHKAASAIAQQAGGCYVIKVSEATTTAKGGPVDIFWPQQSKSFVREISLDNDAFVDFKIQAILYGLLKSIKAVLSTKPDARTTRSHALLLTGLNHFFSGYSVTNAQLVKRAIDLHKTPEGIIALGLMAHITAETKAKPYPVKAKDLLKKAEIYYNIANDMSEPCGIGIAHCCLASLLLNSRDDKDGAETEYRLAIKCDSRIAIAHLGLAWLLNYRGDDEGAKAEYRSAIDCDQQIPSAHFNLGVLLDNQEDYDGAEREYRIAIENDRHDAGAHINLGMLLKNTRKDDAGAEDEYRKATKCHPHDAIPHFKLAYLLRSRKDYTAAADELRKVIKDYPQYASDARKFLKVLNDPKYRDTF